MYVGKESQNLNGLSRGIKSDQGFVLTPGNIDNDPHYKDMLGDKVQTEVKNQKGKKIS